MYLLFVDESGTHGGSHSFVLGGLAIHEEDAARLQNELDQLVVRHLGGKIPVNLEDYELHASELRNAKKPTDPNKAPKTRSIWMHHERPMRLALLEAAYRTLSEFKPIDPDLPVMFFGVVVDKDFRSHQLKLEKERFAYEVLLNKFDVMLKGVRKAGGSDRGLVIHDRRVVAEQDIQSWTAGWRVAAGNVGRVRNLADVPLFADSRASRLLQAADLLAYCLYRRYEPERADPRYFNILWPHFDQDSPELHACVHFTPNYGSGCCLCEPCTARMKAEAQKDATELGRRASRRRKRAGLLRRGSKQ